MAVVGAIAGCIECVVAGQYASSFAMYIGLSPPLCHSLLVLWVSGLRCWLRWAGIDADAELLERGLRDVKMEFRGPINSYNSVVSSPK